MLKKLFCSLTVGQHMVIGFLVRMSIVLYSEYHDKHHEVKFTDIDYHVFTDAAREVLEGSSPFQRHTYRYTPFLAMALTPNITLWHSFGKVLFNLFDTIVSLLIYALLRRDGCLESTSLYMSFFWLYNPFVIGISCRGSSDSIQALLVIILIYFLKLRLPLLSGLTLGTAIHFKLYPIIYIVPVYLSFTEWSASAKTSKTRSVHLTCLNGQTQPSLLVKILPSVAKITVCIGVLLSFGFLTGTGYYLYGQQYIDEAFLYHLKRLDIKHNFSLYFYSLYLNARSTIASQLSHIIFLIQFILCLSLGIKYSSPRDTTFAFLTQTMVFVTFNKVITSQYFLWFLVLIPLVYHRLNIGLAKMSSLFALWILAQSCWLLPAYLLEFRGVNTFTFLWLEGIAFFCCNVGIILTFISSYEKAKLPSSFDKRK